MPGESKKCNVKTEMLIFQPKANLDEKILVVKITYHLDLEIRKMPVRGFYRNQKFHIPFWSMIYVVLKFTLSVSELEF